MPWTKLFRDGSSTALRSAARATGMPCVGCLEAPKAVPALHGLSAAALHGIGLCTFMRHIRGSMTCP